MNRFEVNSFQVPNALIDDLLSELSGSELKCYLFIVRKTKGWNKQEDYISISQFMEATKLSNKAVIDACKKLIKLGLVESKTGYRNTTIYSCKNFTCEKSSPVNFSPTTCEKSSHTKDKITKDTNIPPDNNKLLSSPKTEKPEPQNKNEYDRNYNQTKTESKKFTPPTLQEVQSEIERKGYRIDAEHFIAHYTANGWIVGKTKMKCWRSALVTWHKNNFFKKENNQTKQEKQKTAIEQAVKNMQRREFGRLAH